MSKTNSLHYQLCVEGGKWMRRKNKPSTDKYREISKKIKEAENTLLVGYLPRFKWVAVELVTYGTENCDVWGFDGYYTGVIEVKTSHADFVKDKKKWWRTAKPEFQAGNMRWFLCPEGLIKPEELYDGWGLLYWDGKKIYPVHPTTTRMQGCHADIRILNSILRREKFPEKIYNYRQNA